MSAGETKVALRQKLRAETGQHTQAEREAASEAICQRVQHQKVWNHAETVLLYMPLDGEPDLRPLIRAALDTGKTVVLPRFDAEAGVYQACRIVNAERDVTRGRYNILEPHAKCPIVELNRLDLTLIPGVAFTVDGCRLGRGKGYFDRLLSQARGWKCGVAFDWQVTADIPTEQHDIRVDSIVTPTRWHVVSKPGEGGHVMKMTAT